MAIKTEYRHLPEEIEPHCPKCTQSCRKTGPESDFYKCPDCGFQFEVLIVLSWAVKKG